MRRHEASCDHGFSTASGVVRRGPSTRAVRPTRPRSGKSSRRAKIFTYSNTETQLRRVGREPVSGFAACEGQMFEGEHATGMEEEWLRRRR